ncbi:MAG: 23S rRNA (uracil(1939)-C(5))-methyltransferase [Beggiatoa sp. IS2]|nr:MAG: 23S rRNA (uracil(1939)-C(5))-methyltransferase [Beggiatoa sp. IS2]
MPRHRHYQHQSFTASVNAHIDNLAHDGRGVAHIDGKTIFIMGGLPGEMVKFRYISTQPRFAEGIVTEVVDPAPDRVPPRCPHFGMCGGCSMQHLTQSAQLAWKQAVVLEQLQHFGQVQPATLTPPLYGTPWGYRRKARLGARYVPKKGGVLIGFREQLSHRLADLQRCDVLHPSVGERILALREIVTQLTVSQHVPQIEIAVGDTQTACVLRHLLPLSTHDRQQLCAFADAHNLQFYLQPQGTNSVTALYPADLPLASLTYCLPTESVCIQFTPLDFVQINSEVNRQMVPQALAWLDLQPEDNVLDLFCGLGNFTLPIARRVAQVTGVDSDAQLLLRAQTNAQQQVIDNTHYYLADLAATQLQPAWMQIPYDKLLLDPPRAGALEIIRALPFTKIQRIVYVSCNPATLARDAGELVHRQGFQLTQLGIMDMFTHTAHIETMALFER